MSSVPLHRQVLVLTDDVCIRNLFYLMRKLAAENVADGAARGMMSIAEREQYDAIVLDMRCPEGGSRSGSCEIGKIQSSRVDRTLNITAEVSGQQTLTLVERYLLCGLPGALTWLVGRRYASRLVMQPL